MLLIILTPNIILLYLTTSVFNIGITLLSPSSSSLVTKNTLGGQGVALGIMQSFSSLGRIFGPMVGGALYEIHMNVPYYLGAASMMLMVLLVGNKITRLSGGMRRYAPRI